MKSAGKCSRQCGNSSTRAGSCWPWSVTRKARPSLGLAAELADLTLGEMINTLPEYGVQRNLETEDYLKGLENLRKTGRTPRE